MSIRRGRPKMGRTHVTTTLPDEVIVALDSYAMTEGVSKNLVIEVSLRRFLASEEARKKKVQANG